MDEVKLADLSCETETKISLMAGSVFVSYQAASYFAQPWSLKDKKKGLTIRVTGFEGVVDFDIFGDLIQVTGAEEIRIQQSLSLQEAGQQVTVCGVARASKSIGLLRINFRKEAELIGSAAIALKFSRARIDVLPLPFADYKLASVATGRGGPDADWHFESGLGDLLKDIPA